MAGNQVFLKKAHLKGYKSILDVNVEFQEGLNIIIGKNGAGKSKLLVFLFTALEFDVEGFLNSEASIALQDRSEHFQVSLSNR